MNSCNTQPLFTNPWRITSGSSSFPHILSVIAPRKRERWSTDSKSEASSTPTTSFLENSLVSKHTLYLFENSSLSPGPVPICSASLRNWFKELRASFLCTCMSCFAFSVFHCRRCSLRVTQHFNETPFKHYTDALWNSCIKSYRNIVESLTHG